MLRVSARALIHPTEDPDRVIKAVQNLVSDGTLTVQDGWVYVTGGTLAQLAELIRNHQIPDTARGVMLRGRRGEEKVSRFMMGKQAALMGRPNFGGVDSPLGSIEITLEADEGPELVRAVYEAAPDTTVSPEWSRIPYDERPEDVKRKPLAAPVAPTGEKVALKQARQVMRADEVDTKEEGGWETLEEADYGGDEGEGEDDSPEQRG
ncbi:MAG TPA: hypothetical protein VNZ52_12870 [Candidatus Thermoplasmatota archaeon]|nr:hypothetical protein [Candidatus Thermoplasmatota archaeon]